ncbi:MAG: hypothetical protein U1A78_38060 [Polyangia bacterium]
MSPSEIVLRSELLTLYTPLSRAPASLGLELTFLICAALTLLHALRARRRGDLGPLFIWASTLAYGLMIEILSYNYLDNFTHGQFTVMLYHRRLPLYIAVLYPVFIYTAIQLAALLQPRRFAEPFLVGLIIVVMDLPYDISGPDAGWWVWSAKDPNLTYRWHGVPVTSYYWHLAFGGSLAFLVRSLRARAVRAGSLRPLRLLLLSILVGVLTLVLGVLSFLPYHGLKSLGISDGVIVGGLFVLSSLIVLASARSLPPLRARLDGVLALIAVLYVSLHSVVAIALYRVSTEPEATAKLAVKLGAAALLLGLTALLQRRGAIAEPHPPHHALPTAPAAAVTPP